MSRKCKGRELTRAIIGACLRLIFVVGCAHELGRRSIDLTAPLTSGEVASSPPNPLRSADSAFRRETRVKSRMSRMSPLLPGFSRPACR